MTEKTLHEAVEDLRAAGKAFLKSLNPFRKPPKEQLPDALPFDIDFAGVTYEQGSSLRALIRKAEMFKSVGFQKQEELNRAKYLIEQLKILPQKAETMALIEAYEKGELTEEGNDTSKNEN